MIASLFRKEFREQRLFALLLLGIAGVLVAALPFVAPLLKIPSQDVIAVQQGVLILFAVLAGVVGGAVHWANERETGTEPFLDMMPVPRSAIWSTKTVYAVIQWAIQIAVLAAIAAALGQFESNESIPLGVMVLPLSALWLTVTIATSAWSLTVLGSIGRAIPFAVFLLPIPCMAIFAFVTRLLFFEVSPVFADGTRTTFVLGVLWALFVIAVPLWISYRRITAIDRARGFVADRVESPGRRAFRTAWNLASHDIRSLAWPAGVLLAATAFLSRQEPNLAWMLFGSLLGAWFGVSVIDAEKHGGAYKLWADQRLPVPMLWSVKLMNRLLLLLACSIAIVFLVGGTVFLQIQANGGRADRTFATIWTSSLAAVTPPLTLILIGPLFGLGAGLVFALITPKKVISLLGAGMAALALTVFWLPMVGSGGIRFWQWMGVPLGLAVTSRLLLWPWATGRLSTRATLAGLVLPILAIAGYWFGVEQARIAAVPRLAPLFDIEKYQSVMWSTQAAQAGDRLNEVASEIQALQDSAILIQTNTGMAALGQAPAVARAPLGRPSLNVFQDQMNLAFGQGLKGIKPEVFKAFDEMLASGWVAKIDALAAADVEYANLGTIELSAGVYVGFEKRWLIQRAGELLLIDALRKDEAGDAAGALNRIDVALRVSRWVSRRVSFQFAHAGNSLEIAALRTYGTWLARRVSKADVELLKQADTVLVRHMTRRETEEDKLKSSFLAGISSISNPRNLMDDLAVRYDIRNQNEPWAGLSSSLWSTAISTGFETERRQRLYELWMAGYLKSARTDHKTLHRLASAHGNQLSAAYFFGERYFNYADWVSPMTENPTPEQNQADWEKSAALVHSDIILRNGLIPYVIRSTRDVARRTAIFELVRLTNQLHAYRLLHGDWPKSLDQLNVPGFPKAPVNPMSGSPFEYEIKGKGILLRATDPFPVEKSPKPLNLFDFLYVSRRYPLEFEIPSFEVK